MRSSLAEKRRILASCLSTLLLLAWVLSSVNCDIVLPRQGWNEDWGPLVPHETFPGDCGLCHIPERWDVLKEDFRFDHEKETGYALEGAHSRAACLRCHNDRGPVEVYVKRGCGGCHLDPHGSSLGLDCERCHDQETWNPTGLIADHARTRFPLFGAHTVVPCERCHTEAPNGEFRGAPTRCDLCHQRELARATTPDHKQNGWTSDCQRCHSPLGWNAADFVHDFFPLTGGHGGLGCTECHVSGRFERLSPACYNCHQPQYNQAPNHVSGNFSHDCSRCHRTSAWQPADFRHDFFPLTGGHSGLDCAVCHPSGIGPRSSACFSCHSDDYNRAPGHVSRGFSTNCENCHTIRKWEAPTNFNKHEFFPLTGGHSGLDCQQCHTKGIFGPMSQECYSCHSADYQRAPNHASGNFSKNCNRCHNINAFQPPDFTHRFFPLSGGHSGLDCNDCHTSGTVGPIASDCWSCHSSDFTRGPNHVSLGFSHDCSECHRINGWQPAFFEHTFFPLTGGHSVLRCAECHTSGSFGTISSECISCHRSDYNRAKNHSSIGFPQDCTQCHNTTRWSGASFTHSFPLRGPHNKSCTTCHLGATASNFTCFKCHEHSRTKMSNKHREVRGYSYNAQACVRCHPNGKG